jgi:hypothetical protein
MYITPSHSPEWGGAQLLNAGQWPTLIIMTQVLMEIKTYSNLWAPKSHHKAVKALFPHALHYLSEGPFTLQIYYASTNSAIAWLN